MTDSSDRYTGRQYTPTVALLLVAIAAPLAWLLVATKPTGYASLLGTLAFSSLCAGLAWAQWKWRSELSIPSLTRQPRRVK